MQIQLTHTNRQPTIPRPWSVVFLGLYHEHAIVPILLISIIPVAIIFIFRNHLHDVVTLGLTVLTLLLIAGGARHYFLAPFTKWLKRHVVGSFQVVYFRSFDEDQSHAARDMIAPILGCIGHLTTIHNPTYIQGLSNTQGHDQSEDSWFAWLELGEVLSDGLVAIKCEGDTWKQEVQRLLAHVDLAVIDVSVSSANIAWERSQALSFLPEDRVIAIRAANADASKEMDCIEYELSAKGRNRFRRALKRRLAAIKRMESKMPSPE